MDRLLSIVTWVFMTINIINYQSTHIDPISYRVGMHLVLGLMCFGTGTWLYSTECLHLKPTLCGSVGTGLLYADLIYVDLFYMHLFYADLCYADIFYVDLCYVDLCYADLCYADLCYADIFYVMWIYVMRIYFIQIYVMEIYVMRTYFMRIYSMWIYFMCTYSMQIYAMRMYFMRIYFSDVFVLVHFLQIYFMWIYFMWTYFMWTGFMLIYFMWIYSMRIYFMHIYFMWTHFLQTYFMWIYFMWIYCMWIYFMQNYFMKICWNKFIRCCSLHTALHLLVLLSNAIMLALHLYRDCHQVHWNKILVCYFKALYWDLFSAFEPYNLVYNNFSIGYFFIFKKENYHLKIYWLKLYSSKLEDYSTKINLPFKCYLLEVICILLKFSNFENLSDENDFDKISNVKFVKIFNELDKNYDEFLNENVTVCLIICLHFAILIKIHPYALEKRYLPNINDSCKFQKTKTYYLGCKIFKIRHSVTRNTLHLFETNFSVLCPEKSSAPTYTTYTRITDKYCKNTFPGCQNYMFIITITIIVIFPYTLPLKFFNQCIIKYFIAHSYDKVEK